jgi:hypothetical protein
MAKKKKTEQKRKRASRGVQFQRVVFVLIAVIMIATLVLSLIG